METRTYEIIAENERTHWWYRARRRILHAVVDAYGDRAPSADLALDLGCGTGANLPVVARFGSPVGCDFSDLALDYARGRGGYQHLIRSDAERLPFAESSFGWLFATDILEHLDDRVAAAEMHRVLRPGGRAVVTVPAFPALWGAQDDASHHRRRYTRSALVDLMRGAGFRLEYMSYINTALFLPIFIVRRAVRLMRVRIESENTLHPGWTNPVLERIFGAEARLVPRYSLPFGVSLLCVAARPTHPDPSPRASRHVRNLRLRV